MSIWSVGYWSPSDAATMPIASIDMAALTHVSIFAAYANTNGTLDLTTQPITTYAATMVSTAHTAGVKVMLALLSSSALTFGGHTPTDLHDAMTNHRVAFVAALLSAVSTYGFDGIDLNWENYSGDETLFYDLMGDLRAGSPSILLQATIPVSPSATDRAWWGTHYGNLDKLAIETYDLVDSAYSWFTSALYGPADDSEWSVELAKRRYVDNAGIPASVFMIGMAFQGWQSTGGSPNPINGPRIASTGVTLAQKNYTAIQPDIGVNGTYVYDTTAQAPYLSGNSGANSWITYENELGIAAKINYVRAQGLGGWIIFNLATDRIAGANPLLAAVKAAYAGSGGSSSGPPVIAANRITPSGKEGFVTSVNWTADTIKIIFLDASYVFNSANTYLSDILAASRVFTSGALSGKTATSGKLLANDIVLSAVTGNPITQGFYYKDTGVEGTSRLLVYFNQGTNLAITPNGKDILFRHANGDDGIATL